VAETSIRLIRSVKIFLVALMPSSLADFPGEIKRFGETVVS
jgi:hypothetical protein